MCVCLSLEDAAAEDESDDTWMDLCMFACILRVACVGVYLRTNPPDPPVELQIALEMVTTQTQAKLR